MFCDCKEKISDLEHKIKEINTSIHKLIEYQMKASDSKRDGSFLFDQVIKRLDSLKSDAQFYRFLQYWKDGNV